MTSHKKRLFLFVPFSIHDDQNLSTRLNKKAFFITMGWGMEMEMKIYKSLTVFFSVCLFHQVPDSLLIFTLFGKSVWISIVITMITVSLAYTMLLTTLTMIDGREEERK